jgi:N-acetylglucosamine-6-phosphate deacetylase
MNKLLIKNCLLPESDEPQDILCIDGAIAEIGYHIQKSATSIIDAQMKYAAPGLLDIHVHGAGGIDFLHMNTASYQTAARTLASVGTTGFLATVLIDPRNPKVLSGLAELCDQSVKGARLLGIHAEGPFINTAKKGGFPLECIHPADIELFSDLIRFSQNRISMMTLAPEVIDQALLDSLRVHRIIPAVGHTDVSYKEMKSYLEHGLNHLTHVFNAMNGIHHREPGPILAAWEDPCSTIQIISDGVHLSPTIVKMLFHLWGPDRCILITDGLNSQGLPDGEYEYIGKSYVTENGLAKYHDGTLIGTTFGMLDMVAHFKSFTNCSLSQAINAASLNPAKLLGLHTKGVLAPGYDADIILFDSHFDLHYTIIQGNVVHYDS